MREFSHVSILTFCSILLKVSHSETEQFKQLAGDLLRKYRESKGVSYEYVAEKTGLHRTTISQYERGMICPSLYSLIKISEALEFNPEEYISKLKQ